MSCSKIAILLVLATLSVGALSARDEHQDPGRGIDNDLLRDEPLTIVFRRICEDAPYGRPWRWYWSINSGGRGELTISCLGEPTRRKVEFSAEQWASLRQALSDSHFTKLKESYGPLVIHGGWDTLTVVAGEHINKTVRFNSTYTWPAAKKRELTAAAPALRVWLKAAEMVDPEGTIFDERRDVAKALKALKNKSDR
jgi:hypothetical protein